MQKIQRAKSYALLFAGISLSAFASANLVRNDIGLTYWYCGASIILILCGITILFAFHKIRASNPNRRDGMTKCRSCSTHMFPTNGCCSYCGAALSRKTFAERERTAVGIPNFYSLRKEINSKIRRRKAAFFLGILAATSIIAITYYHYPNTRTMRPLPFIVMVVGLPLLYLHSRVWAATACPQCRGNLQRLVEMKVDPIQPSQPAGIEGLPKALKVQAKVCPHCKADFDYAPGHSRFEQLKLNGLRVGRLRLRHTPGKFRRAA